MKRIFTLITALFPSRLRIVFLRVFLGANIGKHVRIGFGTILLSENIDISDYSKIGAFNYIKTRHLSMGKHANIGNRTHISVNTLKMGHRTAISSQVNISGSHDVYGVIEMGMYSWIFPYCYVNVVRPVRLGKNVGVGGGTYIFTHGLWLSKLDGYPVSYGEVVIGDDTWLPWGCFIMPGVNIGKNVIVGARSVVTKSVPDGALVVGIPAKVIRDRSNGDLSVEQKFEILDELIHDYARCKGLTLAVERVNLDVHYNLNGSPFIIIHSEISAPDERRTVLNIFWQAKSRETFIRSCSWSLGDYVSSPEAAFSSQMKEFLAHGRTIGLRFYPIDEL